MAEQLINEFTVNRPIEEAWPIITNVELIAPCLPGAELRELEGDTCRGIVKVKLGPIATEFEGEVNFTEQDDEEHRVVVHASGRDKKGRGNATADITAQAESLSPTSMRCVVTWTLHMSGKVSQFGRIGVLEDVSGKLMADFARNLNEMLDDQGLDTADSAAVPTPEEPENAPQPAADDADADEGIAAAAPKVRTIGGPAAEPIDLMELGGSSVAKRVLPALLALIVLLLLVRRRRS
jgi:carbon monoxide dehydrogenase subunit G